MGYCYTREAGLFLLADGMGGHPEGEVAAQMALKVIADAFERDARPRLADAPGFLVAALHEAHRSIRAYAIDKEMSDTPRTTLVAALIQDGQLHCLHCGDSRLYLMRDGALLLRTRDHSMAARFGGSQTHALAINRNVLYTCLGSPADPEYDLGGPVALVPGDRLLLCSDGFWDNLEEDDIVRRLCAGPVSEGSPVLVDQALLAGGPGCDNVTVLSLEWEPRNTAAPGDVVTDGAAATEFASTLLTGPDDEPDVLYSPDAAAASRVADTSDADRSIAEIQDPSRPAAGRKD